MDRSNKLVVAQNQQDCFATHLLRIQPVVKTMKLQFATMLLLGSQQLGRATAFDCSDYDWRPTCYENLEGGFEMVRRDDINMVDTSGLPAPGTGVPLNTLLENSCAYNIAQLYTCFFQSFVG